jgi:hypothetical protein
MYQRGLTAVKYSSLPVVLNDIYAFNIKNLNDEVNLDNI